MADYLDEVFGPVGALAGKFPGYSPREGQVSLARAVSVAIESQGNLVAEAMTGTGKSIAYLVPAIYHAKQRGTRAVIVTANIALQEQLVRKDLPLLKEIMPWTFTYALLKGRSNYLCLDRLHNGAPGKLHADDELLHRHILKWADETEHGDVSELTFEPPGRLWSRFSVTSDDCAGKDCEYYAECYANAAQNRAREADVIVTNYALFFSDMKVREVTMGHASLLPTYGIAILDEGHKASEIARDFFGFRISEGSIQWAGGYLPDKEKYALDAASKQFFRDLLLHKKSSAYKARIRKQYPVEAADLLFALDEAGGAYIRLLGTFPPSEDQTSEEKKRYRKIAARSTRTIELRRQILDAMRLYPEPKLPWRPHPSATSDGTPETTWYWSDPAAGGDNTVKSEAQLAVYENVYFIEEEKGTSTLNSKPISVAPMLRARLFTRPGLSTTVTSATLLARNSFDYVCEDLGVDKPAKLIAASPFSWNEQALLILPQDVPEPQDPNFVQIAAQKCVETIKLAEGRTLALFTSYKNMNAAHEQALRSGYRILRQGDMPRTRLIDEFRKDTHSVLMGVESFWAGVDVPGESLSCVFIDKLPFTTPEDPIMDALSEREKDWFKRYSIPKAIIAFKQGFGRLIRSTSDRGVVVVLDKRITTKFYGSFFLAALPNVQRSSNLQDVRRFLNKEPLLVQPASLTDMPMGLGA